VKAIRFGKVIIAVEKLVEYIVEETYLARHNEKSSYLTSGAITT